MNPQVAPEKSMRSVAQEIFLEALAECGIDRAFPKHVEYDHGVLRIGEDLYPLDQFSKVFAISIGKAGHSLAEALVGQLGSRVSGIVASPVAAARSLENFEYFQGGHPLPNEESMRAAETILRSLREVDREALVVFMISGGGSAVAEKPLSDFVTLEDLIATYQALVLSGAPIAEINTIRKHLSAVKGGRLALAAEGTRQVSILISDVPEKALDSLASGPTMPDGSTCSDCYEIVARHDLLKRFPNTVREIFRAKLLDETPKSDEAAFVDARWWPILSSETAASAAAEEAKKRGFRVEIDNTPDDWDYKKAADYLLNRVRKLKVESSRVCLISAGEVTVKIGERVGSGGRNQQFALYCASQIAGENMVVLSAGTDGIDGNSAAAGAAVDGTTKEQGDHHGLNIEATLDAFNANFYFEKLGDAVMTGPTGTNVRDLRVLLAF